MIRTIRFFDAASAQRFAKALSRPTEFQISRSVGDGTGYDLSNPRESEMLDRLYALAAIVQRRGCTVRTDAGESVIQEGMLRCHAAGSVE